MNNYRDTLLQAQQDQTRQTEDRQKLVSELKSLQTEASQNIEKADSYLKRTGELMRVKR